MTPDITEEQLLQANTIHLAGHYALSRINRAPCWATPEGVTPGIIVEETHGIGGNGQVRGGYTATLPEPDLTIVAGSLLDLKKSLIAILKVLKPELADITFFTSGEGHYVLCSRCGEMKPAQFRRTKIDLVMNQPQCGACRGMKPPSAKPKKAKKA